MSQRTNAARLLPADYVFAFAVANFIPRRGRRMVTGGAGCSPKPFTHGDTMNPTVNITYETLDMFLTEMIALFPPPFLHLGGDEVGCMHGMFRSRAVAKQPLTVLPRACHHPGSRGLLALQPSCCRLDAAAGHGQGRQQAGIVLCEPGCHTERCQE